MDMHSFSDSSSREEAHLTADQHKNLAIDFVRKGDYSKAIYHYQKGADMGNVCAQNNLGDAYVHGKLGLPVSYEKAFEYFQMAAEQNNAQATLCLGIFYENGWGVPKNLEKAFSYYKQAVVLGSWSACTNLGDCYRDGIGVEPNGEMAFYLYECVAKIGCGVAWFKLGECHQKKIGVAEVSYPKAIDCYMCSAQQHYSKAYVNLGLCYQKGLGVKRSLHMAFCYFKMAANKNEPSGHRYLALSYEKGMGVKISAKLTLYHYQKAADLKDAEAQNALGDAYLIGKWGLPISPEQAIDYYMLSSQQGCPAAWYNLGLAYKFGKGLEQSFEEAFECFKKAADKNYPAAHYALAICYEQGIGINRSDELAFTHFQTAANLGDIEAQTELGNIFLNGRLGIKLDGDTAFNYYYLASSKSATACYYLGLLFKNGSAVQQSFKKAFHYFSQAAQKNHPQSHRALAQFYEEGLGTSVCYSKAIYHYQKAAEMGDAEAQDSLGNAYLHGKLGLSSSYEKAIQFFSKLVIEHESSNALYNLGLIHRELGTPKSLGEAFNHFTLAAEKNHPQAHQALGYCYEKGLGSKCSLQNALYHYKKAAELGSCEAQKRLGEAYSEGQLGLAPYDERSFTYFKQAAEQNDAWAIFNLAHCYAEGKGVECSPSKAFALYRLAAEQDLIEADRAIAGCYLTGLGVEHSEAKGIQHLEQLAKMGDASSQFALGLAYARGKYGLSQSLEKSLYYYQLAADQNFPEALMALGNLYEEGIGGEVSLKKVFDCYFQAAEIGNAYARNKLGLAYWQGNWGLTRSYEKAIYYFELAAQKNLPNAYINLGHCYKHGRGAKKSYNRAFHYYKKAAECNLAQGHQELAVCYEFGVGTEKSLPMALEHYEQAARLGDANAESRLGDAYCHGQLGIEKSHSKAIQYYKLGAGHHNPHCEAILACCYAQSSEVKANKKILETESLNILMSDVEPIEEI